METAKNPYSKSVNINAKPINKSRDRMKQDLISDNSDLKKSSTRPNSASQPSRSSTQISSNSKTVPKFVIHSNYALVVNESSSSQRHPRSSNITKPTGSHISQIIQSQQPQITVKPRYNNKDDISRNNRLHNYQTEPGRSQSATIRSSYSRSDSLINSKSSTIIKSTSQKPNIRQRPATNRSSITTNLDDSYPAKNSVQKNYDSLNRPRQRTKLESGNDRIINYYSLPRSKSSSQQVLSQNESATSGKQQQKQQHKRSILHESPSDSSILKPFHKPATIKINTDSSSSNSSYTNNNYNNTENSDANQITFSTTLAKAGTHSPPIKRRSSVHLQNASVRMPSRFATKSTINDIYIQKNQRENYEKFKKVAAEIFKENLTRRFGENITNFRIEEENEKEISVDGEKKVVRDKMVKKEIGVNKERSDNYINNRLVQDNGPIELKFKEDSTRLNVSRQQPQQKRLQPTKTQLKSASSSSLDDGSSGTNDSSSDSDDDEKTTSESNSIATDEQASISSIPKDEVPLGYQGTSVSISGHIASTNSVASNVTTATIVSDTEQGQNLSEYNKETLIESQNVAKQNNDAENNIFQHGTVTSDFSGVNLMITVDEVHLSGEEEEDDEKISDEVEKNNQQNKLSDDDDIDEGDTEDEFDLNNELSDSSDQDCDIESLKASFMPLYEIERMDDDFNYSYYNSDLLFSSVPDYQTHSQSFRIEKTSQAFNEEVFVHKESLQIAKDALLKIPEKGIISKRKFGISEPLPQGKKRTTYDPHILLLDACLETDFELIKTLIPKVPDISKSTVDGITALHNAVCSGDSRLVLYLLQNGANVNASDADGWTPLHCSACCNNKQISKILVEHGASLFSETLSDNEIPSQKCNKTHSEDQQCEEYLFWEQENLGVMNNGIVYALFNYTPENEDELPLVPNQILKVLDTNPPGESGWFLAEDLSQLNDNSKRGMVAAAYVSSYQLILSQNQMKDE